MCLPTHAENDPFTRRAQDLIALGIPSSTTYFHRSHTLLDVNEDYEDVQSGDELPVSVMTLCGRVMWIREESDCLLVGIEDQDAQFQLAVCLKRLTKRLALLKTHVFRGDYIGVEISAVCRLNGWVTGMIDQWHFLSTTQRSLPPRHDTQTMQGERSLRLANSIDARDRLKRRSQIMQHTRQFLCHEGMIEFDTLCVDHSQNGAPGHDEQEFRELIAGGIEQLYQFRSNRHIRSIDWLNHPQALQLEGWLAMKTPEDAMRLIEQLVSLLTHTMHSTHLIQWQSFERLNAAPDCAPNAVYEDCLLEIDLSPHWAWRTVAQLTFDNLGIDFTSFVSTEDAVNAAIQAGLNLAGFLSWKSIEDVMLAVFQQIVVPTLIQPVFVVYTALGSEFIDRFELYINGLSFGAGYRDSGANLQWEMSAQVLARLPGTRWTLQFDRLVMLLLGVEDIRDAIAFPSLPR